MLTIAYMTSRKNPRIEWFFESLNREWDRKIPINVVIVDLHAETRGVDYTLNLFSVQICRGKTIHTAPKPNVWQGKYRLTQKDYFSASNARNTALLHAEDGYIAYVDDLSVLLPGWFQQVVEAMEGGWVACGAYAKVKALEMQGAGRVKSFLGCPDGLDNSNHRSIAEQVIKKTGFPGGLDSRINHPPNDDPFPCGGSWMFGASVAMPVEALLEIGGWDHRADSMGGEDYLCGIMLEKHGYKLKYCRRMMTLESEEAHYEDEPLLRVIKGPPGKTDASWQLLNLVMNSEKPTVPDEFGNGGIREVRKRVLAGGSFPVVQIPQHHWYDGQPLSEM